MNEQCPKCGAPRAETACPKCGLVYEKYRPDMNSPAIPSSIAELWDHVEEHWDDEAAHALFMEKALSVDQASFVATCYRQKGEDPTAKEQIERLTQRLMQELSRHTPTPQPRNSVMKNVLYVLMFIIIAVMVFLIFANTMK